MVMDKIYDGGPTAVGEDSSSTLEQIAKFLFLRYKIIVITLSSTPSLFPF